MPSSEPPSPTNLPPPAEDDLLQTLMSFVNSPDWASARAVLDAHPELLDTQADRTLSTLLMSTETSGNVEAAAILAMHLEVLRLAARVGPEEAFRQAEAAGAAQDDLLGVIANNTLAVMTQLSAKLPDWQATVEEIAADARAEGDEPLARLLGSVRDLLTGDSPQTPDLPPGSPYLAAWEAIVGGLVEYARNAAQQDMFAVIAHNVRQALAGGEPGPAYWATYFGNVRRMADDLGDPALAALSAALVRLLESGSAAGIEPELEGAHGACWQAIIGELPAETSEGSA